jgi:polyphosphate kinase
MEVLAPVRDPALRARLDEILELLLSDDTLAWELAADGSWRPPRGGTNNVQTQLEEAAVARARRIASV